MNNADLWHLDKKIPIGLIVALAVNAVLGIWYVSKLDSRISILEQRASVTTEDMTKLKDYLDNSKERLIRVESKLETILDTLQIMQSKAPSHRRSYYDSPQSSQSIP